MFSNIGKRSLKSLLQVIFIIPWVTEFTLKIKQELKNQTKINKILQKNNKT